jgi:hypothetical protein
MEMTTCQGKGVGKVLAIQEDGLVGQVYFEVHPDHLDNIFVELYGSIEIGLSDCAENGVLLSKSSLASELRDNIFVRDSGETEIQIQSQNQEDSMESNFSWKVFPYPSYNEHYRDQHFEYHPRSTGAIMAAAEFEISDPIGTSSEGNVWYPTWDPKLKQ